jgi:hypothetical protein
MGRPGIRRKTIVARALLAMAGGIMTAPTHAASLHQEGRDDSFYGPLRARDLTPFGYLRLDMRPPFAGNTTPGAWSIEAELAYQNTWAVSATAARYLEAQPHRDSLTSVDLANIGALAPESFLVDMELSQFDLLLHRQLDADWGAFLVLSGVHYGGGLLDGVIEEFHDTFRMRNYGRPAVRRGQINIFFDLDGAQYAALDAEPRTGLLDPTVGVRYSGARLPDQWQLVIEAAAKVPLAGARAWLSTGRLDLGVQATLAHTGARHALYANLALVHYAGTGSVLEMEPRVLPTFVMGWEQHLSGRTHSIVQFYVSPSVYGTDETRLDELTSTKYQLSIGLRHHRGPHLYTFAITENVANLQNTPDVGMQFGWAYRR